MDVPTNALKLFNDYKNYYQKTEIIVRLVTKTQMALTRCVVPVEPHSSSSFVSQPGGHCYSLLA